MAHFSIDSAAADQGAAGAFDEFLYSVSMEFIDHFALVFATLRLLTIHQLEFELDRLNELLDS